MKHTKHTPGPWKIDDSHPTVAVIKGADSIIVAEIEKVSAPYISRKDANANLIAAAPELLQIAEAYRNLLKTMAHTDAEVATFHHIESVLAKARGES